MFAFSMEGNNQPSLRVPNSVRLGAGLELPAGVEQFQDEVGGNCAMAIGRASD